MSIGYVELLWQTLGDIQMPWWKQFWYKFSWPKYNILYSWWFVADVLRGIIYASVASKDPCVSYAEIVKKISLISFSTTLSVDIFGTLGGMCGTNHASMFPHWQNSLLVGVRLLSRLHFFKLPGFLDPPLLFGISGWKGTVVSLRISF